MSLGAAIGQIDQILDLQQQIADPGATLAASPTSASGGAGLATGATTGAGESAQSFASMLADAQQSSTLSALDSGGDATAGGLSDPISSGVSDPLLSGLSTGGVNSTTAVTATPGLTTTAALTGVPTATSSNPSAQLQAMTDEADSLVGKPYVWGGGHSGWGPQAGYDCSGFVSAVLHAGGYLSAPQDTQTLPSQPGIENGPGQTVTIYDRTDAGMGQDHVIIDLGGQFYESGGGQGAWGGGGGVERIGTPSAAYLASFNRILHPAGM